MRIVNFGYKIELKTYSRTIDLKEVSSMLIITEADGYVELNIIFKNGTNDMYVIDSETAEWIEECFIKVCTKRWWMIWK